MATVSELIGGTFDYLGRPDQGKLSLGLVLPLMLDAIKFYTIDLQLSGENYLLQSFIFTPLNKEGLVTAPGFSVPVAAEIRDVNSLLESDWKPINISNVTDVNDSGRDGEKVIGFFGTPTSYSLSFDPVTDWNVQVKLWYEPLATEPAILADSPKISQAFHTMIKLRTALACSPYLGIANPEQLTGTLMTHLGEWERKWKTWVNLDRNARPIQRRDFRGPRRLNRWVF